MKLNMSIIAKELSYSVAVSHIHEDVSLTIRYPLFVTSDQLDLHDSLRLQMKNYVCVLDPQCGISLSDEDRMHVIIADPGQYRYTMDLTALEQHEYLVFNGSAAEVLQKLNMIFHRYNAWEERLQSAVIRNASYQEVLDIGKEMFVNPIAYLDPGQFALAKSGEVPRQIKDSIMREIFEYGYIQPENIRSMFDNSTYTSYYTETKSFITRFGHYPERYIIANVFYEDRFQGVLTQSDVSAPFGSYDLTMMEYLRTVFEKLEALKHSCSNHSEGRKSILHDLLNGESVPDPVIEELLNSKGMTITDSYLVMVFIVKDPLKKEPKSAVKEYLAGNLLRLLSETAFIAILEDRIVAVVSCKNGSGIDDASWEKMMELISGNGYLIAESNPFSDFRKSRAHMNEALAVARFVLEDNVEGSVFRYKDYFVKHMLSHVSEHMDAELICHPDILKLWDHDRNNETDYVKCLHLFLLHGGNLTKAAKAAYMHRSTFVYKIEKSMEMISADIEDEDILMNLLISCYFLLHLYKEP